MPEWDVQVRVEGDVIVTVEADTEDEARDYARDAWSISDIENAMVQMIGTVEKVSNGEGGA